MERKQQYSLDKDNRAIGDQDIVFIEICGACGNEQEVKPPLKVMANRCKLCGSVMLLDRVKGR